ncbi:MAG: hypothetical protein FJ271_10565 [Planctomycetes bacterium]|nr:hypothetical protein [Planctomycetota bacterium]
MVLFALVFGYTAIVWVAVIFLYSFFIESFDFGALSTFAWKSALLVGILAAVTVWVPYGGFFTLFVWALGLLIVFQKDLWESRVLIILLWSVNFVAGLVLRGLLLSASGDS